MCASTLWRRVYRTWQLWKHKAKEVEKENVKTEKILDGFHNPPPPPSRSAWKWPPLFYVKVVSVPVQMRESARVPG